MLSTKFIVLTLVAIVIVLGLGIFPPVHTFFSSIDTTGLDTEMLGVATFMPYVFIFAIFYAGYVILKRGK